MEEKLEYSNTKKEDLSQNSIRESFNLINIKASDIKLK